MTARDVTGFYAFSPPGNWDFGAVSLPDYTENLEKTDKIHWQKFKKSSGEGAPKLQFLSLVVVERILTLSPA